MKTARVRPPNLALKISMLVNHSSLREKKFLHLQRATNSLTNSVVRACITRRISSHFAIATTSASAVFMCNHLSFSLSFFLSFSLALFVQLRDVDFH